MVGFPGNLPATGSLQIIQDSLRHSPDSPGFGRCSETLWQSAILSLSPSLGKEEERGEEEERREQEEEEGRICGILGAWRMIITLASESSLMR